MLDVHPPHEPVHGWRDFLVHILTITIGLLIALALEAAVEARHHRREVAETREALRQEREENQKRFARDTAFALRQGASYQNNLLVLTYLQQHPGTPQAKLPGFITWTSRNDRMTESAWKTAQQSGIFAYMPGAEVQRDAELYDFLERIDEAHEEEADALLQAMLYMVHDPDPSHLDTGALAHEVELTGACVVKDLRHGFLMENLHAEFPEFSPAPTHDQLVSLLNLQPLDRYPELKMAIAITEQRMDAAAHIPK